MLIIKKNYFSYLYIFFLTLVIFFNEFSTNFAISKNYIVSDIKVEKVYNLNFKKTDVVDEAFDQAFKILMYKLIENKDKSKIENISLKDKKSLIENFSINNEQFINEKYIGQFNVQFNKRKILNYLNNKNIIPSSLNKIDVFILPILIDTNLNELFYLNQNMFYNNWNKISKKHHLINYILPNKDIEDYYIIKKNINNIENYNFEEITKKYNLQNEIILIIIKSNSLVRIFSKIKFGKNNLLSNDIYTLDDINSLTIKPLFFSLNKLTSGVGPSFNPTISLKNSL